MLILPPLLLVCLLILLVLMSDLLHFSIPMPWAGETEDVVKTDDEHDEDIEEHVAGDQEEEITQDKEFADKKIDYYDSFSDDESIDKSEDIISDYESDQPDYHDEEDLKVISDGDCLLALVTKETTLKEDYEPADLKPVPNYMNPPRSIELREMALEQLKSLWYAAKADGIELHVLSTYRSYEYQEDLFNRYAESHGPEEANKFSARAGQSEHQLGTTVDFGGTNVDFTSDFGETDQGTWLADNAHIFGFVMSYPENKKHITGYIYEPWHYRYIGVDAAMEWKESGKTLNQFLEDKPQTFE